MDLKKGLTKEYLDQSKLVIITSTRDLLCVVRGESPFIRPPSKNRCCPYIMKQPSPITSEQAGESHKTAQENKAESTARQHPRKNVLSRVLCVS